MGNDLINKEIIELISLIEDDKFLRHIKFIIIGYLQKKK